MTEAATDIVVEKVIKEFAPETGELKQKEKVDEIATKTGKQKEKKSEKENDPPVEKVSDSTLGRITENTDGHQGGKGDSYWLRGEQEVLRDLPDPPTYRPNTASHKGTRQQGQSSRYDPDNL